MVDEQRVPAKIFPVKTIIIFCLITAAILVVFGIKRHVGTATENVTVETKDAAKTAVSVTPKGNGGVFPHGYAKGGEDKK